MRDDSVYDHPPFALRQMSRTEPSAPSSDDDDGKVAILRRHFPAAPRAELQRFAGPLRRRRRPSYRAYQRWRFGEGSNEALQQRAAPLVVGGESSPSRFIALGERLATDDGVGKRGDRVVLVEGARFDPAHISSSSYAAHVCRTLDAALASDDASQFVVLIDCRAERAGRTTARRPSGLSYESSLVQYRTAIPSGCGALSCIRCRGGHACRWPPPLIYCLRRRARRSGPSPEMIRGGRRCPRKLGEKAPLVLRAVLSTRRTGTAP